MRTPSITITELKTLVTRINDEIGLASASYVSLDQSNGGVRVMLNDHRWLSDRGTKREIHIFLRGMLTALYLRLNK
jgi:hypothetical protein